MTDTLNPNIAPTGNVDALLYGEVVAELSAELATLARIPTASRIEWARCDARADGLARACSILSGIPASTLRQRLAPKDTR